MGLFGGAGKDSYLGVDIGAGGIKLVELANEKGRATLLTYGYTVRKPGDAIVSPFDDTKGTGELLSRLCLQSGTKATRALAALPISSVFSTIISIPRRKDEKEMKPLIDAQVAKLTPLPLSDMITYSTFIDNVKGGKGSKGDKGAPGEKYARVLVTGAAKSLVQKYMEIFKYARLNLLALDTEAFALIRSLIGKDKSSVLLLDIGSMRTNITVVEKGIPFMTRSINVGGTAITRRIMEKTGLNEDQAEQMKTDLATGEEAAGGTGGLLSLLDASLQPILNEIQYSLQIYSKMEQAEARKPEKIVVTGGTSLLPRVTEFFSDKLNLNVYRGDPWARVAYPQDLRPVLDEIGPRMSVAVGLAMREID